MLLCADAASDARGPDPRQPGEEAGDEAQPGAPQVHQLYDAVLHRHEETHEDSRHHTPPLTSHRSVSALGSQRYQVHKPLR